MMGFFRGKDLNTGEWVRGYWNKGPDSSAPNSLVDIINVPTYDLLNNCLYMNTHRIVPQTLGQYTGLFDTNDQEICEGDIVEFTRWTRMRGVVRASGARFILCVPDDMEDDGFCHYSFDRHFYWDDGLVSGCNEITYTIVGNIYDNPDKLTIASE